MAIEKAISQPRQSVLIDRTNHDLLQSLYLLSFLLTADHHEADEVLQS
jgi:hypothetical protein